MTKLETLCIYSALVSQTIQQLVELDIINIDNILVGLNEDKPVMFSKLLNDTIELSEYIYELQQETIH